MKTRSSSSGDVVPASNNSSEAKLQIVDLTLPRRKSLHGLNRPRPSSRRSKGRGADDSDRRSCASKGFRLPKGWTVEAFPRRNSYHIDRFYVERKTGKRFRSLVSVERYLNESGNRKDHQQQLVLLQQHHRVPSKDFNLPDGWIVEEKRRRNCCRIDRFYIEPGTGKRFRSLPAVETYLNGGTVDSVDSGQLSILANPDGIGFESVDIDPNPPEKVKWVLTGPGGKMFSAHVSGSDVSGSVQKTWSEAFVSLIQERV
ncbi:Methyl-CpG-binding domain-containing protein 7 [Hirschfeldia incana]|nr:Methyl-CpG-binding domain-containing protein 7 [Hirschfeldia incana]